MIAIAADAIAAAIATARGPTALFTMAPHADRWGGAT
jgi:hypothetical protein